MGPNRRVSLEDRASLPFTNAVLMESMRMATIVPNALPHTAMEDIQIKDYVIPKVIISSKSTTVEGPRFLKDVTFMGFTSVCFEILQVSLNSIS